MVAWFSFFVESTACKSFCSFFWYVLPAYSLSELFCYPLSEFCGEGLEKSRSSESYIGLSFQNFCSSLSPLRKVPKAGSKKSKET